MKHSIIVMILLISGTAAAIYMQGCDANATTDTGSFASLLPNISDYHIFQGNPAALTPANGYHVYELSTGLFTDYAEKQRLINVPEGYTITATGNGLPDFPDETVLVKTFYYYNDKRDTSKGKRLIETRLLVKSNGQWNAGTYIWNKEQTDAVLATRSFNTPVTWINKEGATRNISYHIPAVKDCGSCHNTGNSLMPLGIKIRNLNINVVRDHSTINQLRYFQQTGIMKTTDPSHFAQLPSWQNSALGPEERVRAYLDVNCAHCHSDKGSCSQSALRLGWDIPFEDTRIAGNTNRIIKMMSKGRMPRTGTTIIDEEAVALITTYLKTIK
jgi:uncharacterized repeat protein (TIGR03806 family)